MTLDEFMSALCVRMGWGSTPWRVAVLAFWAKQEGMPFERSWNPLATTYHQQGVKDSAEDVGFGAGRWNSVGVGLYATPQDGIEATARTLGLSYYVAIRMAMADQTGWPSVIPAFKTWIGSDAYSQAMLDFMLSSTADRGYSAPAPSYAALAARVAALEAIAGPQAVRDDWVARQSQLLVGFANQQAILQGLANNMLTLAQSPSVGGVSRVELVQRLQQLVDALRAGG